MHFLDSKNIHATPCSNVTFTNIHGDRLKITIGITNYYPKHFITQKLHHINAVTELCTCYTIRITSFEKQDTLQKVSDHTGKG